MIEITDLDITNAYVVVTPTDILNATPLGDFHMDRITGISLVATRDNLGSDTGTIHITSEGLISIGYKSTGLSSNASHGMASISQHGRHNDRFNTNPPDWYLSKGSCHSCAGRSSKHLAAFRSFTPAIG